MKYFFRSEKLKHTKKVAKWLSRRVGNDCVVCLTGDLGAGKTTFTKFFLKYLGVKDCVSSPTFTIVKNYITKKYNIYHMDLYRIADEQELIEIGFGEMLASESVMIIEWPQIAKHYLPDNCINIEIRFDDNGDRTFEIEVIDDK